VEVVLGDDDLGLVLLDLLDLVAPLAGGLERGLHRLGAAVHRQGDFGAGQLAQLLGEGAELVVVEGARGDADAVSLILERPDELGVPVAMVDRRVGAQHVHVLLALGVLDPHALGLGDDDRERVVVVRAEFLGDLDDLLGGSHAFLPLPRGHTVGNGGADDHKTPILQPKSVAAGRRKAAVSPTSVVRSM